MYFDNLGFFCRGTTVVRVTSKTNTLVPHATVNKLVLNTVTQRKTQLSLHHLINNNHAGRLLSDRRDTAPANFKNRPRTNQKNEQKRCCGESSKREGADVGHLLKTEK